jgi:hypothetical protein
MAIGTHIWVADVAWSVPGATPNPATFKKYLTVASDLTTPQKDAQVRAVMAFDFGEMAASPNSVVITNVQQFSP